MAYLPENPKPPTAPGMTRWVKISGSIAIILIVLVVVLHLSGNSPMHHSPAPEPQGQQR